jgi:BlaI family transcriptional regulator, penicillinase repressor
MSDAIPTDAELAILNVLWRRGEATVREVYEDLYRDTGGGYTTALKMLQIMHAKGLVNRSREGLAHVYTAAVERDATQRELVSDLVVRAFDGSPSQLVLQALGGAPKASAEELQAIMDLIHRMQANHER